MTHTIRRSARRAVTAVIAVLAASVLLTGCLFVPTPDSAGPSASASPTPDTEGVAADLVPFYGQELDWGSCAGGTDAFDCATVAAPLDWDDPGAGQIELAVIRHRATGPARLGSLLTNPGGPGASGVGFIRDAIRFGIGSDVMASYDVIGFDPRGVGESTAVRCFDTDEMDAYLYDLPDAERGSDAWLAELNEANAAFADACEAHSGGILPFITTVNAARDMDLLRAVLGDTRLNYIGFSYGTFLGATYADLYPDRVGRMVLDGAVDPTVSMLELSTVQTIGFESALRAYMADCLTTRDCPFRGSVDDGMADIGALLAAVDARPLRAADGRELGVDTLWTAIVYPLYSESNWQYLTMALAGVMGGDPEVAFVLADAYYGREPGGYADNQTEAFRTYNCADYPREADPVAEAEAAELIAQHAPTVAPYWDGPSPCDVWPHPATGTRGPLTAAGAVPILVIGTTNDPATPYEWSVSLAGQLESGVLITRVGEGHTGFNRGSACVDRIVIDYLVDDVVPDGDVRCE